jgi:hypothetical protein
VKLEFESKKDAANIFCSQCRRQLGKWLSLLLKSLNCG